MNKFTKMYPLIMRLSLVFVFVWFGVNEISNPVYWSGYVPPLVEKFLPFGINLFVQLHGVALSILALALLFKFYIRYAAFLSIIVLFSITGGLIVMNGLNEIAVRDIGLLGLALSIWLYEIKEKKKQ